MSQVKGNESALPAALIAAIASVLLLSGIFVATMLVHYRAIDLEYLQLALLRIGGISLAVAAMARLLGKHLCSASRAGLFGAIAGFAGGLAYVAVAA